MADILQRVAAKGLIVNADGKVLILREAHTYIEGTNIGKYGLPGGRIDPGEKFFDGLEREIMEETGLKVEPLKPIYVGEWFPTIKGVPNHITAIFYACKALTTDVALSEEHDHYEWIDPERYADFEMMDPDDDVVKSWITERAL
jgi:8-oxo-dGTP pyrophosphatase MutT (NUDIX family)